MRNASQSALSPDGPVLADFLLRVANCSRRGIVGLVFLAASGGCGKETDGGDSVGDTGETATEGESTESSTGDSTDSSSEESTDSSAGDGDGDGDGDCDESNGADGGDGTSDLCAMMTEEECLASNQTGGPCRPVLSGEVIVEFSQWCEGPLEYLGCIDEEDKGCGINFVCKEGDDEKMWWINSILDCTPPGYEPCGPPPVCYGGGEECG